MQFKNDILPFPKWKPQFATYNRFSSSSYKIRLQALRNSSSGFIKRKDVRFIIFNKDSNKCVYCGTNINLTIDHIVSVYKVANFLFPIEKLNIKDNLQSLCLICNSQKKP